MEVRIGIGVDQFHFGMTQPELISALGAADKQYTTDSEATRLQYFDLRIEFSFEPANENRLGWIEVHNPTAKLLGLQVVGEKADNIIKLIAEALAEEPEYKDFGSFESFFFPKAWLELQAGFGRIFCVNLGVIYDERDEPRWPEPVELAIP